MKFIGDYTAEFKRGPDKKPRKKRNWGVTSAALGAIGGTVIDTGMRGYQVGKINKQVGSRFVKSGKPASQSAVNRLAEQKGLLGKKSLIRSAKAYGAGAAAGLGVYGAYKLSKRIRDRKKGK